MAALATGNARFRRIPEKSFMNTAPSIRIHEKQFMAQVVEVATLLGWLVYHTYDSRRSTPGFPDLTMCKRGRLILAELKTDTGKVSPAQSLWLSTLASCPGVEVYTWRPAQWDDIVATLRR